MPPAPLVDDTTAQHLQRISRVMDSAVRVPGTKASFGLDPILGLVPVVGDVASMGVSLYTVTRAAKAGVSKWRLSAMVGNIALDAVVGLIPFLGDALDFAFKANQRNLKLLGIDPGQPPQLRRAQRKRV